MLVEIPLSRRAASAMLILVAVVCALLARQAIFNFIVFSLSDSRSAVSAGELNVALGYFPSSARLRARSAEAQISDPARDLGRASREIERAIRLSPNDYRLQAVLATVMEAQQEMTAAENALRTAESLAPSSIEVRWRLANLLLRRGKISDALVEFRAAVTGDQALMPAALDLVWHVTGGDLHDLESVVPVTPESYLTLANFLLKQGQALEAARVFESIDRQARIGVTATGEFINSLVKAGDLGRARQLWVGLLSGSKDPGADTHDASNIWNGGFESDPIPGLAQFDWNLGESEFAAISIDNATAHLGNRSLRIDFAGRDTTRLDDEINQKVVLKAGSHYRLECFVKTRDLVATEGPRLTLRSDSDAGWTAAGTAIAAGTVDWRRMELDFVAPQKSATPSSARRSLAGPDTGRIDKGTERAALIRETAYSTSESYGDAVSVTIKVARIPRFSYEQPMRGTIWLDDFRITQIN
jgi:hypothetical protein